MGFKIIISLLIILWGLFASVFGIYSKNILDKNLETALSFKTPLIKNISEKIKEASQNDYQIIIDEKTIPLPSETISSFLEKYHRNYTGRDELRFNLDKIHIFLTDLAPGLNREPINAKLALNGDKVSEFSLYQIGRHLNIEKSTSSIIYSIINNRSNISLAFDYIEPKIKADKINSLGINTLLARGISDFKDSPKSRIHNIKVGAQIFNGVLLEPGEEFSFNDLLGEVDAKTGYLPELVIKRGNVIPEYGGGLCQVSTTAFRAAVLAGLEITQRRSHSLPVRYYNPQGFDATIYPGLVNLKFINDTPGYILIQTKVEGTKLIFEFYGSSDGRKVELDGPHQYIKEKGKTIGATLKRKIFKNGELTKEDVFESTYRSADLYPELRNPLE